MVAACQINKIVATGHRATGFNYAMMDHVRMGRKRGTERKEMGEINLNFDRRRKRKPQTETKTGGAEKDSDRPPPMKI